jgi:hypothetical protein
MTLSCRRFNSGFALLLLALAGTRTPAFAQNWMTDARRIGMGGVAGSENLASRMIESPDGAHSTIVIPLGLFQVLNNLDIYDPDSEDFDPIRAVENAAAPLHYTFNRNGTGTGTEFINDLLDGRLNRDINTYRDFIPTSQPVAYGLVAPNWGITIPVYKKRDGTTHSVYAGGGLYLPTRGALEVDDQLKSILSSDNNVYVPNSQFRITGGVRTELPIAITGGYRGRFKLRESGSDRDGLYVAFNYNYLRGFWYEDVGMTLRLDTDSQGLLTFNPAAPFNPIEVLRAHSTDGHGMALDFGAALVVNRIEVGFGINGLANRIKWTDIEASRYSLSNILTGNGDFAENTTSAPDATIKQPIEYVGSAGYHAERWQLAGEIGVRSSDYALDEGRLGKTWVHTGFEYRFGLLEPRAGAYYSRKRLTPAAGLGLNFGKFGIDVAAYSNDANVEHVRHPSIALSLRIGDLRRLPSP